MMGHGDRTRGEKLPEAYSPASRGSGRASEFQGMPQAKEGSWQPQDKPVGYFRKQDPERRFILAPLVRGHQKGTDVWWWVQSRKG